MGLLDKHQKTDIRYKGKDFILYEPRGEKYNNLQKMIEDNLQVGKDGAVSGELALSCIREVMRTLTNIGDEVDDITDEDFVNKLNNGDRELKDLLRAIEELVDEVVNDIVYKEVDELKKIKSYILSLENNKDLNEFKDVMNNLFKNNGYDITYDELLNIDYNNPQSVNKMIEKLQKK